MQSLQQTDWFPQCVSGMAEDVMVAISITSPKFEMMIPILQM